MLHSVFLPDLGTPITAHPQEYIKMPKTADERLKACEAFYLLKKFPQKIGAIDCTHVKIQSPCGNDAETVRNRKGWFSINVQTIAIADLKVCNLVTNWPGSSHDQTISNSSAVKRRFEAQAAFSYSGAGHAIPDLNVVRNIIKSCCILHKRLRLSSVNK